MESIKTGIASFGMSGQVFHAPFIHTHPHFRLCCIVERSKTLSKEKYPDAAIARSVSEMLENRDIELVVINTPDSTHYEYARMALEAGKHVVVEKPFTMYYAQAEELIALAKSRGLMLSVYQNRRWDADFLTVGEIIDKGLLGELVAFESIFSRYRNFIKPDTWKETGSAGGGLTYNLGSHLIDQAVQLFGLPEAVYADIAILRAGGHVDDYFRISLLRPERCPQLRVTLKAGYLMREPEPRFVLHGTLGSYVKHGVDGQEEALLRGEMPNQQGWGEEDEQNWGILHTEINGEPFHGKYPSLPGNYNAFYQNIYEHLRLGRPLATDACHVSDVIRIIEGAYQSSRKEKVIYL
ncbi:MAG: Gfo/Idh/MocA family oxidoreductase [Mediterranea sp.]|jgi:predicted dehydrogenase|nr:Gfo/Idh/MocA family oxidoreductase [Mediterranea sp.]